jgi:hypothetical protein
MLERQPVMNKHHVLASFLVALSPALAVAAPDNVPCPDKKAGQWYRFAKTDLYRNKSEVLIKIDRVEGDRLIQNGGAYVTDKMHNWLRRGDRVANPKYYSSIECPFSLGERRVYKDVVFDGAERATSATMTVAVESEFTTLVVTAGSFKVVKMVSDNNWTKDAFSGRVRLVSYYSPEIGISVKTEVEATWPERFHDVFELLEYSLGD